MKVRYRGRLVDSDQTPRRSRSRFLVKFWFRYFDPLKARGWSWGNAWQIFIVNDATAKKELIELREKWLAANAGIRHKIKHVTADYQGGDL